MTGLTREAGLVPPHHRGDHGKMFASNVLPEIVPHKRHPLYFIHISKKFSVVLSPFVPVVAICDNVTVSIQRQPLCNGIITNGS